MHSRSVPRLLWTGTAPRTAPIAPTGVTSRSPTDGGCHWALPGSALLLTHGTPMKSSVCAFVLTITCATTVPAFAQWPKYQAAGVPKTADGKPDMNAPTPKLIDGRPDLSGG